MTETLEKLKKDLWEIINLFQKVSDARDEFSTHFYGWSFLRLKCIAELEYLKTSLDYALYRCDIYEAVTGSLKLAAELQSHRLSLCCIFKGSRSKGHWADSSHCYKRRRIIRADIGGVQTCPFPE
ncbi:UNVERIFIED_CONTAM: hypothetical protein NCL1_44930 [Trichonephila clavipes]